MQKIKIEIVLNGRETEKRIPHFICVESSCTVEWRDGLLTQRKRSLLQRDRILFSQSIQRFSVGLRGKMGINDDNLRTMVISLIIKGMNKIPAKVRGDSYILTIEIKKVYIEGGNSSNIGGAQTTPQPPQPSQKTGEIRMKRLMTTLLDGAISSGLHKEVMSCENTAQLYNKIVKYFPNDFNNASLHSLLAFMAMSLYMDFREGEIVETAWRNYAFRKSDMAWVMTQLQNSGYVEELKVKTLDANTYHISDLTNVIFN